MKFIYSFGKIFTQIPKSNRLLQYPLHSRNQARKIPYYYTEPLPNDEIANLLGSLQYFSPNDIISIMKKQIKFKQIFGKDEFTQFFLTQPLDSVQMANLILLCYKLNLAEKLWIKCLDVQIDQLSPYYLSETMWALKGKKFTSNEIQNKSNTIQQKIIEQIPEKLENFDFYCLSLMMQSLSEQHQVDWNELAKHFLKTLNYKDYFSLTYGLYALAKNKYHIQIDLNNTNLIENIQQEIQNFRQSDLLMILWSMQKLQIGTEEFWNYSYKYLKSQRLQNLQSIAMQSQILSQLYRVEEYQWQYIESQALNQLKPDEKSLVTLFQTFSLNKKGSQSFWNALIEQILKDINTYKLESLFQLASHSEQLQFTQQIPIEWKKLSLSQQCLLFNKYAKIGLNIDQYYQIIIQQVQNLQGRDLILVLYTLYKYANNLSKEQVINQLENSIAKLNHMDIDQLLELKDLSKEIYQQIIQYHSKSLTQKQRELCQQLQLSL